MLFWSGPTQQKYSRTFLKNYFFFDPPDTSDPVRHFFQNPPKPVRKRPQTTPRHIPRHPKIDQKVTPNRPRGAGNRTRRGAGNRTGDLPTRLPKPLSEGQTTRLFRPHKRAPLRSSYVSEIQILYVKNTECARAGFSVAKIARARSFL